MRTSWLWIISLLMTPLSVAQFKLPPLPYDYAALEPSISALNMCIHHDKHHQKYVDDLNDGLKESPELFEQKIEDLVKNWRSLPDSVQQTVRKFGGGHLNHSFFWTSMTPHKQQSQPAGALLDTINKDFGDLAQFKERFSTTAKKLFGSGWVWLCLDDAKHLKIVSTINQDNPLSDGLKPLLTIDLWEHAYYPTYANKRADFIDAWWNIVNWGEVERRYDAALKAQTEPLTATLIIPGISGDLSKRKIIPALYALVKEGMNALIIGTSRRELNLDELLIAAQKFIPAYDARIGLKLRSMMLVTRLDTDKPADFVELNKLIAQEEKARTMHGARVVYLSVPSESFVDLSKHFVDAGIIKKNNPHHRIAYEKPIGHDETSAQRIIKELNELLTMRQIFFIDHYLARNAVQCLPTLIASNPIFKHSWNNKVIKEVQIFFDETIGVEERGEFYDRYGALKDVIQNHVLQLLAITACADTLSKNIDEAQIQKAALIRSLRFSHGVLGQYEGYTKEKKVSPTSSTETFAALTLFIDNAQWQGVPFYVQTGKKLHRKATEIRVLFVDEADRTHQDLVIRIAPREEIALTLATCAEPQVMLAPASTSQREAYANIFEALIKGSHTVDVSAFEIEAQWDFISRIMHKFEPLKLYAQASSGPGVA